MTMTSLGSTVCWKMISGCDFDGRPIYGEWATGEVIGHEDGLLLVRRTSYPFGTVLVRPDQIA
jgi:hypothetical protein